jgi:Uma2 family endonuclease
MGDAIRRQPGVPEANTMPVSIPRSEPAVPTEPIDGNGAIPPLKDGDRLSRDEFERRYNAMPQLKKAELIEGVVSVPSPVGCEHHGEPHSTLGGWFFLYRARTRGVRLADNASVRLDLGNMPQPDCLLFISPDCGGRVRIDEDDYVYGAPDLIAEIAASSAHHDLNAKRQVYQREGVREYIIWRVLEGRLDWFVLREAGYEPLAPGDDGILRSTIFPGLWLDPAALLRDDCDTLLEVLERGLDTPEHAAFKAELQRARVERTV